MSPKGLNGVQFSLLWPICYSKSLTLFKMKNKGRNLITSVDSHPSMLGRSLAPRTSMRRYPWRNVFWSDWRRWGDPESVTDLTIEPVLLKVFFRKFIAQKLKLIIRRFKFLRLPLHIPNKNMKKKKKKNNY